MRTAIYPGSFDPITNGHLDILERATKVFDKIYVTILVNPQKKCLFSDAERQELIEKSIEPENKIIVTTFDGLLTNYAVKVEAQAIIRGLRAVSDFDYEFQMALTNRKLNDSIDTVFFMTSEKYSYLNSGLIKQLVMFGADVSQFVPDIVEMRLKEKFNR
ncbi:MAG: pantetheine-phosphate adenylyltransferase [Candidatus Margulisiibacteriota bacterium]|nr:MAG: pantetheine-phosphate adenylyltransferase [Candidatus Margulisbacteria bacterium GWD2_39_127]OGI03256.1 MAG: pantetheine-phosphate adenylyltransferase [Candidatus Margulisbacteria bacterium GWF2_38_17]OGI11279.1 MAG: pantetheine-phosphate adenylyltransferase [Candidatus Margulisbacteria bacterium GWE2_39_32]PZM78500.1 MAG: pantetheine-phosphate adenylyltransferase [Candidatus Margulisiibacteriota bacterium]HAR63936.1 pantetheine-phosphate adenylyltransferase [Candidatus Margulisiibacter